MSVKILINKFNEIIELAMQKNCPKCNSELEITTGYYYCFYCSKMFYWDLGEI